MSAQSVSTLRPCSRAMPQSVCHAAVLPLLRCTRGAPDSAGRRRADRREREGADLARPGPALCTRRLPGIALLPESAARPIVDDGCAASVCSFRMSSNSGAQRLPTSLLPSPSRRRHGRRSGRSHSSSAAHFITRFISLPVWASVRAASSAACSHRLVCWHGAGPPG